MSEPAKTGISIEENELLFGHSDTKSVTSIEFSENLNITIFYRGSDGSTLSNDVEFEPVLLLHDDNLLYGAKHKPLEITEMKGGGYYKYLARFHSWNALEDAIKHLVITTGCKPSAPNAPYLHISDPVHQYMLVSGDTHFKGMRFSDLKRLTIDIETDCADEYDFSNAKRESDRILLIGINISSKPGVVEYASVRDMDEKAMLIWLCEKIKEYDPDTIEGHNVFKFDLPYIAERAKRFKVKLDWGRDGSEIKFRKSRVQVAERTLDYTRCDIFGRNIVDTWFLAQFYDIQTRSLESFNLKHLAVHFGVAPAGRVYIEASKIKECFEKDYDNFIKYNKDDIIETVAISEILSYGHFIQSRIFPYSYQNNIVRGNATKINSLFIREYIRNGWSIPKNENKGQAMDFEGGLTDIFIEGIVKNVGHCDVRSLYPSIMLTYKVAPKTDLMEIFLPMLVTLRDFRVSAKNMMKKAADEHDRRYYEALQNTFKVLINSFYGYLGSSIHNFSDVEAAGKVTEIGRDTIRKMVAMLKEMKCQPVEIDTDGVYFVPPAGVSDDAGFEKIVHNINKELPKGIEVEYDGRFKSMLSFKMKNYALLDYNNKLTIKGSALKSRGLEKFLRKFTQEMIHLMLSDRELEIPKLYESYHADIEAKKMSIDNICKSETLTESPAAYQIKIKEGKRNPSAQYELALKSSKVYQAGDSVSFYVTGTAKKVTAYSNCKMKEEFDEKTPDYNTAYYIDKLVLQYKKFKDVLKFEGGVPSGDGDPKAASQGELF